MYMDLSLADEVEPACVVVVDAERVSHPERGDPWFQLLELWMTVVSVQTLYADAQPSPEEGKKFISDGAAVNKPAEWREEGRIRMKTRVERSK